MSVYASAVLVGCGRNQRETRFYKKTEATKKTSSEKNNSRALSIRPLATKKVGKSNESVQEISVAKASGQDSAGAR